MNQTEQIQDALKRGDLPEWISRREVQVIEDPFGEQAAEISLIIRHGDDAVIRDGRKLSHVREQVQHALTAANIDLWPYVAFLTEADASGRS